MNKSVLLIGTGPMAIEYAKVLEYQKIDFRVIGRGEKSASTFEMETGVKPIIGGVDIYVSQYEMRPNTYVIIAIGTESLMSALLLVLKAGAAKVLIEKPAAISIEELTANEENLKPFFDKIYVAYNRRFYASVLEAQKMIEEDGGLQTMHFEFTEWAHKIEPLTKALGVKENWFFANSTHVVNLAFFVGGLPENWNAYSKKGTLAWHAKSSFAGAGITEKGVLFSYISNWESAGRWGIEFMTKQRRIYLKPLEKIGVQQKGSMVITEHIFDDSIDLNFKAGLFKQTIAFLENDNSKLISINEHLKMSSDVFSKFLH